MLYLLVSLCVTFLDELANLFAFVLFLKQILFFLIRSILHLFKWIVFISYLNMTKCLFKALKAVGLDKHVELFRSLGYESAGALAHFRTEHFERLNLTEQELLHLISLLDVLKEATRDGKICPHYFSSNKQQTNIKSASSVRASWCDETSTKISTKRAKSSTDPLRPSTVPREQVLPEKTSTILSREQIFIPWKTTATQKLAGARSFLNRPTVEHVKVRTKNRTTLTTNCLSRSNRTIMVYQQINAHALILLIDIIRPKRIRMENQPRSTFTLVNVHFYQAKPILKISLPYRMTNVSLLQRIKLIWIVHLYLKRYRKRKTFNPSHRLCFFFRLNFNMIMYLDLKFQINKYLNRLSYRLYQQIIDII